MNIIQGIISTFLIIIIMVVEKKHAAKLGFTDIKERIWQGTKVTDMRKIPYLVRLRITDENNNAFFCGGSLITKRYVLTAAHCCDGSKTIKVAMGSTNPEDKSKRKTLVTMTVNKNGIIMNRGYNTDGLDYDMCLVHLPKPVRLSATIQTIALPSVTGSNNDEYANKTATVAGWGQRVNGGSYSPDLYYTTSRVITNEECSQAHWSENIDKRMVCIEKLTSGPCEGDSGGPLVVEGDNGSPLQIGVVSFGEDNCDDKVPVVYMFVPSYLQWIKKHSDLK